MKKYDGPARVSVVYFGGQWIVQIVEQGQFSKREFEIEQDAKNFAADHRIRLRLPADPLQPGRSRESLARLRLGRWRVGSGQSGFDHSSRGPITRRHSVTSFAIVGEGGKKRQTTTIPDIRDCSRIGAATAYSPCRNRQARASGGRGLCLERRIKAEPRSFALGEGFGICLGTEALDAYRAVLDDPHIMRISKFLDLDRSLPWLLVHGR